MARQLVDVAAAAGADYVKFQTFKADKIATHAAKKAEYQNRNLNDGSDSQYAMLKQLEMPDEWHWMLVDYARSKSIRFLSTAFDLDSIDFLDELKIDFFKIPSGEITNKPYLTRIAEKRKPIVLSTGMSTLDEVQQAIEVLMQAGASKDHITVLHCNTEYPTPMKDVNLKAMVNIGLNLGVKVGYSDHTAGIEVPIAAVALGAVVIEKHFTLDRNLLGPDHKASIEPAELSAMVTGIRNIEMALAGNGKKEPSESERKNRELGRKSIFYKNDLKAGHVLSGDDLIMLRPGDGVSPMLIDKVIGATLGTDVTKLKKLDFHDLSYGN